MDKGLVYSLSKCTSVMPYLEIEYIVETFEIYKEGCRMLVLPWMVTSSAWLGFIYIYKER